MWIARTMLYSIYKGSLLKNIARRNARKCNMKEEYEMWKKSLSHTVWECKCHVVWIRKKRRKTFNGFYKQKLIKKCFYTEILYRQRAYFGLFVFFTVFCTVVDFAFNKTDGVGNDRKNNRQVLSNALWTSRKVDNECLFIDSGYSPRPHSPGGMFETLHAHGFCKTRQFLFDNCPRRLRGNISGAYACSASRDNEVGFIV